MSKTLQYTICGLLGPVAPAHAGWLTLEEFSGSFLMVFLAYVGLVALCHLLFLLPKRLLRDRAAREAEPAAD